MIKTIDPQEWSQFFTDFSAQNRGRRARFELFSRGGDVGEEEQEAEFESASFSDSVVTITRIDKTEGKADEMADDIPNIHGVSVQYDADGSDNTLELMNDKGDMTVLHFESTVDGDS